MTDSAARISQATLPATARSETQVATPGSISAYSYAPSDNDHLRGDAHVNLAHMELILHFTLAVGIPEMSESLAQSMSGLISQECLKQPYLLHQMMAISSRHLALERPQLYDAYFHQALQLQSKGIALFQGSQTGERDDYVAAMLYSSLLNRHCLADALANRESPFSSFLHRFVQCARLKQHSRSISASSWKQLQQSPISPLLEWARSDLELPLRGHDCDELRSLIAMTPGLDPLARESCRAAVHYIQVGLDQITDAATGNNKHQMAFSWNVFIPDEYCTLLQELNPVAIAIMGWYAILLHHARHLWQISDAGSFVINSVHDYLGAEWAHWLERPTAIISDCAYSHISR